MAKKKKTQPRKDTKKIRRDLRTLDHQELENVSGGDGVPGNYGSSTGGGGLNFD